MQQLLKSMREATKNDDGMDNDASKLGAEMLDSQWATSWPAARRPGRRDRPPDGKQIQSATQPVASKTDSANTTPVDLAKPDAPVRPPQQAAANFVQQHQEAAQAAEAASGIPASFMIAQAAHETGWGRKEIRNPDGSSAHNLFGIKAGANWNGPTTDVTTTEYIGGVARKVVQKFRAYASYAESFADYAKLMANNPRYQKVVAAGSNAQAFAQGLQKAGYATDPAYADKLGRVINTTLRLQRSLQA
jgi:flagellar protein FlgJ